MYGTDYGSPTGTLMLTFEPGETSNSISVPILQYQETTDRDFNLTLSNPVNAVLESPSCPTVATITIDEVPKVAINVASQDVDYNATGVIGVSLSFGSNYTVTVDYTTSDDTAVAGTDYTSTSGTLTFQPWSTSTTISVLSLNHAELSGNTDFYVTLSNPTNAGLGAVATDTVTYVEPPGTSFHVSAQETNYNSAVEVEVDLAASRDYPVYVSYGTSDGTALAGTDYAGRSEACIAPIPFRASASTYVLHHLENSS